MVVAVTAAASFSSSLSTSFVIKASLDSFWVSLLIFSLPLKWIVESDYKAISIANFFDLQKEMGEILKNFYFFSAYVERAYLH